MTLLGSVTELWRYPVKSMQGERLESFYVGQHGIDGDRRFAFESADAPLGKPLLRSAQRASMLQSQAILRPGGEVLVHARGASLLGIRDPSLPAHIVDRESAPSLALLEDDRPFTDVRPIALHSVATVHALAQALGDFDGRRLRSNLVLTLDDDQPFAEDTLAGATVQLGRDVRLTILEPIPRCHMVSLDPETAAADRSPLRWLAHHHNGRAGIYARTLVPGTITVGDAVYRID